MLKRITYLENRRVLADSGEITTNISVRDPITALMFELRAQNGGTYNLKGLMAACVDSIDIIDGSEVLFSLDGYEALALSAYALGHIPSQLVVETEGLYQNWFVIIPFGRFLGDTEFSFDPTRFNNPQIRFKWNLANVNAVGATGFLTGTGRFTIIADVMDGAPAPSGMLIRKEIYSFVPAASGIEYIDLPTDMRHRALYIRCHEDGVGGFGNITNVKVSCDQDKFTPFNMGRVDFLRWLSVNKPPFNYKHLFKAANGTTVYAITKYLEETAFQSDVNDCVVTAQNNGIGEQALIVYTAGSADSTYRNIWAFVHGWLPFGVVEIAWGDPGDRATWLDNNLFKSIRLELTQGNAGGVATVVVEQERLY